MNDSHSSNSTGNRRRDYSVVISGFLLQMGLQVVFQQLLAMRYGSSGSMDAYVHAVTLPLSVSAMIAGALGPILITLLGNRQEAAESRGAAASLVWGACLLGVLLAGVGWLGSGRVMAFFNPGFEASQQAELAKLFEILIWLLPLNILIGLLQAVLNSYWNFSIPALAGAMGPLTTVLVVWFFTSPETQVVAWATVAGAVVNVLIQLPWAMSQMGFPGRLSRHQLGSIIALVGPLLGGMVLLKMDPNVDRYVLSLLNDPGASARQNWAFQVTNSFLMIASGALSTVAFPRIAFQARKGLDELGHEVAEGLGMLIVLCLPAVASIVLFADVIVRDLFERGEFRSTDTAAVAGLMRCYTPLIIGAALGELSGKTMISLRDSLTPNLIGGALLCIGFGLKYWIVADGGVESLAAITAFISLTAGLLQLGTVAVRVGPARVLPGLRALIPAGVGTALALLAGRGILQTGWPFSGLGGLFVGAGVYFGFLAVTCRGSLRRLTKDSHP